MTLRTFLLGACSALAFAGMASAETLTIATVNNGDMIRMQKLTDDFKKKNPDIDLEWVTLEENVLRQKVTTDIATKGGPIRSLSAALRHGSPMTPAAKQNCDHSKHEDRARIA